MKKSMLFFAVIVLPFLAITSCEEIFQNKYEEPFELVLVGDTAVQNNKSLSVGVRKVIDGYVYEMFIPPISSGFTSHSYSKDFATVRYQGWYKVRAHKNGWYEEDSLYVRVIPDPVPCTGEINEVVSYNSSLNYSFGKIYGKPYLGDYQVEGHTWQADMYIVFADIAKKPKTGTYKVKYCHDMQEEGEVCVQINIGFYVYGLPNQKVHVFEENGKTYISLCDFEMTGGLFIDAKLELED